MSITCQFSLSGIKELKIVYQENNNLPIQFPLYPFINPSTGAVKLYDNGSQINFQLLGTTYNYIDLTGNFNSFNEQLFEDEKGRWFEEVVNLSYVLDSNYQTLLANKHVFALLTDNNGKKFIIGYKNPLKLVSHNYNSGITGDGADKYDMIYSSKSYSKLKNYELL